MDELLTDDASMDGISAGGASIDEESPDGASVDEERMGKALVAGDSSSLYSNFSGKPLISVYRHTN